MVHKLSKFLNERYRTTHLELEDFPTPVDEHEEIRRYSYKLGQHDLIVEMFSALDLENTNLGGSNNEGS